MHSFSPLYIYILYLKKHPQIFLKNYYSIYDGIVKYIFIIILTVALLIPKITAVMLLKV